MPLAPTADGLDRAWWTRAFLPGRSWPVQVLALVLIIAVPAGVFGLLEHLVFGIPVVSADCEIPLLRDESPLVFFLFTAVITPIFETAVVVVLLRMLSVAIPSVVAVALVIGALSGVAHGLAYGAYGGPAWGFFIYALAFTAWATSYSRVRAFGTICIAHGLQNLAVLGLF